MDSGGVVTPIPVDAAPGNAPYFYTAHNGQGEVYGWRTHSNTGTAAIRFTGSGFGGNKAWAFDFVEVKVYLPLVSLRVTHTGGEGRAEKPTFTLSNEGDDDTLPIDVELGPAGGTAIPGVDWKVMPQPGIGNVPAAGLDDFPEQVTVPPNARTPLSMVLDVTDDAVPEWEETVTAALRANPNEYEIKTPGPVTATVTDNDISLGSLPVAMDLNQAAQLFRVALGFPEEPKQNAYVSLRWPTNLVRLFADAGGTREIVPNDPSDTRLHVWTLAEGNPAASPPRTVYARPSAAANDVGLTLKFDEDAGSLHAFSDALQVDSERSAIYSLDIDVDSDNDRTINPDDNPGNEDDRKHFFSTIKAVSEGLLSAGMWRFCYNAKYPKTPFPTEPVGSHRLRKQRLTTRSIWNPEKRSCVEVDGLSYPR